LFKNSDSKDIAGDEDKSNSNKNTQQVLEEVTHILEGKTADFRNFMDKESAKRVNIEVTKQKILKNINENKKAAERNLAEMSKANEENISMMEAKLQLALDQGNKEEVMTLLKEMTQLHKDIDL